MKFEKLLLSAATAFCLVGASGAAMADNTCPGGYLSGVIEDDVAVGSGTSCVIQDASISGDIIASGAEDVIVISTKVAGAIKLDDGSSAAVIASSAKNIRIRRNEVAIVLGSIANRNLVVNANVVARVKQNGAVVSIICRRNADLDESRNNTEGEEDCRG